EDEVAPEAPPEIRVERLALAKAEAVFRDHPESLVIGADTVVDVDGRSLGKPRDRDEAVAMLRLLSGRHHWVHTGLALVGPGVRRAGHEGCRRSGWGAWPGPRQRPSSGASLRAWSSAPTPLWTWTAGAWASPGTGTRPWPCSGC